MTGGVSDLHREVVAALGDVITEHGFALAGGNALLAHGLSQRPTRDVNLHSNRDGSVAAVAGQVEEALRAAGFYVERLEAFSDSLLEQWPDLPEYRAEWTVARRRQQVVLQIGISQPRLRPPVTIMGLGPVLDVEDVLANKVLALVTRAESRDFVDVYHALGRYTPEQLIELAWKVEPQAYTFEDFTGVPEILAGMEDEEFAEFGLGPAETAQLRARFADWPRYQGRE